MSSIKVLLVDDHEVVRAGFQQLLDRHPEIEVVAEANNSQEAFDVYKRCAPDVVIMDLNMPVSAEGDESASAQGGIEAVRRILSFDATAKVIVLTVWGAAPYPTNLVKSGVKGYLTKNCAPDELVQALLSVAKGGEYFSESIRQVLNDDGSDSPLKQLTSRELQIFTLLAEGKSVSEIANEKCLSPKTVHAHRSNIMRKLGVKRNAELTQLAIRYGLLAGNES